MANPIITARLWSLWDSQIQDGIITEGEMAEMLKMQVSGEYDLSSDELDPTYAQLMWGQDVQEPYTKEQYDEWRTVENEAASEWLKDHEC